MGVPQFGRYFLGGGAFGERPDQAQEFLMLWPAPTSDQEGANLELCRRAT
jgi:hypothetical protein